MHLLIMDYCSSTSKDLEYFPQITHRSVFLRDSIVGVYSIKLLQGNLENSDYDETLHTCREDKYWVI